MEKKRFRCRCCHKICTAKVKDQKYCSQKQCQRARRNAWYREKCSSDPDYRANQRAGNQAWLESKGGAAAYFREYRRRRKLEATKLVDTDQEEGFSNGSDTESESETKGLRKSAKLDVEFTKNPFKSGRYFIIPEHAKIDAKLDPILVEIAMISTG